MIIRQMNTSDIPQLASLYKQFWNEESCVEKMNTQFKKICQSDTHVILSAVENDRLVGSVMGIICEELYGLCAPFMVLENMVVDKESRRKGVGKALISELERVATERNCTQIILITETNRIDACNFYESAGYDSGTHQGFKKKLNKEG